MTFIKLINLLNVIINSSLVYIGRLYSTYSLYSKYIKYYIRNKLALCDSVNAKAYDIHQKEIESK